MARLLGSTPFADLLANSLAQDAATLAIAESLDSVLAKSSKALPELLIYARLAEAPISQLLPPMQRLAELAEGLSPIPDALLDLLAWQFHVDGYEAAVSYEDKRRLVDRSILMHRRKGTPWAVTEAMRSLGYADARIFEGADICRYNGEINYDGSETYAAGNRWALFDVEVDLGDNMGVSAASVLRLRVAIEAWKNARSHLRAIRWRASIIDSLDLDELLEILTVHATFRDFRRWGLPCYDGSINYDNDRFLRHDGSLNYGGLYPYYFCEPGQHCYGNLIDPLSIFGTLRYSELVRPALSYDGFMPHNGDALYGNCDAPAWEAFVSRASLLSITEFVSVKEQVKTAVGTDFHERPFLYHDGSITYGPPIHCGQVEDVPDSITNARQIRFYSSLNDAGLNACSLLTNTLHSYHSCFDSCHSALQASVADSFELDDDLQLSVRRVFFQNGQTMFYDNNH